MRRRSLVIPFFCLFAFLLLFSQLATATATFSVNEAACKFLLETERTGAQLAVENNLGREVRALVRLELLDPQGVVRARAEREEVIRAGRASLFIPLPFKFSELKTAERNQFVWYRLRYVIEPVSSAGADSERAAGILSLSNITPDLFEVHVAAPSFTRGGALYRARARAVHPTSGRGVAGVRVDVRASAEEESDQTKPILNASGVTDEEGYVTLDLNFPPGLSANEVEMKLTARRGRLVEEADQTIRLDQMSRIFLSTDKPLYQPGQTLHARALVFNSSLRAIAERELPFKITDPEGTVVFRSNLKTSRFGVASTNWEIPENARLGDYTVAYGNDDNPYDAYAGHTVRISRYDLPNFVAKVKPDRQFYLPGQMAEVEVRADYLFGQPVRRGHVRVVRETEREWNYREQKWETEEGDKYEGETDSEGRFLARINLAKEHEDLKDSNWSRFRDVTYAAYFTDASTGRTEQRRVDLRVTKEPIHVYVIGDTYDQSSRLPLEFYVSTFYADGSPAECEVVISEGSEEDNRDDPKTRTPGRQLKTLKTNSYGLVKVSDLKPPLREDSEKVYLRFAARDQRGATGHRNEDFYYRDEPALRVATDKTLYRAQEPVRVQLVSSEKDLSVVVEVLKDLEVLRSELVRLRDGRGSITFPYDERFQNEVTVSAYADVTSRDYVSGGHTILYPHDRDLKLDVRPGKESYRPGEDAHVNFNVRGAGGHGAESALGVVIFDRAVEERSRTDQEFGSGFNLYGNFGGQLGWNDSLAGVTRNELERLDMSKPQPEALSLVAEVLLNRNGHNRPNVFSGLEYELSQPTVFAKLIETDLKPALDALKARYESQMEYPSDETTLRRILRDSGINFDALVDPWGLPYRARFSVEREREVLKLESAGADKKFDTTDDFSATTLSWPYFRAVGEAIDRAQRQYHARTGGYIRDAALLKLELRNEGIDLDVLRDPWGEPYALEFSVKGINYVITVKSGGPDRVLGGASNQAQDDFILWTSTIDYFAEARAQIDAALNAYVKETHRFPQNLTGLAAVLARSKITFSSFRDPWGRAFYATFKTGSRYTDRVTVEARAKQGEKPQTMTVITPVTQRLGIVTLRSAGPDGAEGTKDDFDLGVFSLTLSEESARTDAPAQKRKPVVLKGQQGAIAGTILDPQGAVIPNMTVRATHLSSSRFYEGTSDEEGRYVIRNLPPGTYEVKVEAALGFTQTVVTDVRVSSKQVTEVNITLQPGAQTSTVEVTATADVQVQTTSQSIAGRDNNFILSGVRSAEYGKSTGGPVNVITKSGSSSTPRLREYFPETLVWQPSLETDAEGRAELSFKLADNITTWKLSVIGSTATGEIGMAEKEILSFQPFFVEHDPPRVLTEGDRIELPVVLRNYLNKLQSVELSIKPEDWFALLGPMEKRAEIQPGDNSRQTFDFRAVRSVKEGRQRVTALGADASDQVERTVNVHPDGEEVAKTASGILGDSTTLEALIPEDAIKGTPRAELKIYPSLLAHVTESIEGIMARPYGCAEQTISAAYPSLLALRAYKRLGFESPVAPTARRYVQAGYERLLNYRAPDGGFSYWGRGDADQALTAYAIRFLHDAREFIAVDEDVINEARAWLVKQQRGDGSWAAPRFSREKTEDRRRTALLTAFVARILAATESKSPAQTFQHAGATQTAQQTAPLKRALLYLSERATEIDEPYLIASYALAAVDASELKGAEAAVKKLLLLAREEAGTAYWSLETNTPFYGWGLAGRIETTALALQALNKYCASQQADCRLDKYAAVIPDSAIRIPLLTSRGLLFLLRQQDRYGVWYSTQATVNTLDALVTLLGSDSAEDVRRGGRAEVFVNGRPATTIELPPGDQLVSPLVVDLSEFISAGSNRVEIRRPAGAMRASAQVVATYYVPWFRRGGSAAQHAGKDSSQALRLNVNYDRIAGSTGDEITCKVLAERVGFRGYGMLLAEIGLPPGADVDRASLERAVKESSWSLSHYDVLPDRLVVYLWPRAGGTSFAFKFRPRFNLTAQSAPSLLYDYYNPEARTVVAPTKFVIK